jgi:hypothetical protein
MERCAVLREKGIPYQKVRSRLGVYGTAFPGVESRSEFI